MSEGAGRERYSLCGTTPCPICGLHQKLVKMGAKPSRGSTVSENDCCFDIRFPADCRCEFRLRLDVATATYRRKSDDDAMTKMCDFAAAGALASEHRLLVVELKKGAASWEAIRQLQQGLDLLHDHFPNSSIVTRPEAYLVVGKQAAQFKHRLRSKSKYLRFGECQVLPEVHDCGDSLSL